jgi:ribosomal protein L12E/L44/L45/RPP1/RPP2
MTLRGNVQDFPLRSVLELLGQTKKTGELQLRAGDRVGALGIAAGRVVTAVLDEEEPLIALGAIFALEGAEFEFTPWDDAPPANLEGKTLDELLRKADEAKQQAEEARRKAEEEREAARKKAEEEREAERKRLEEIRALIPSDDVPLRLSERAVDQGAVTLTAERWRLVLAVNGERGVNAIAAMLHMGPGDALTSLAALVRDGVVEPVAQATPTPPSEAPAYDAPPTYEAPPTY